MYLGKKQLKNHGGIMARENFNTQHVQVKRHNEMILSTEHKHRNGHKNNSKHIKQDNVIA